jgi:hypothetical protein
VNRIHRAVGRAFSILSFAGVLLLSGLAPVRSDTPWVPAPKLPMPGGPAVVAPDGTIYYADGSILYPNGVYVLPDGTWYVIP